MLMFSKFREDFRLQSGSQTQKTTFCCTPCEKVIIVQDTNYITSAIRKLMLDMPSPGRPFNMNTTELRACQTMWYKLGKN